MKDTIQTIRRSSWSFFLGTFLSRITGMIRDISMAYVFGTQPAIAAFMVAFRFAHLLRRLFGEGALQSAFIPEFESLRQKSEEEAVRFFRNLSFALTVLLIFFIGLSAIILIGFIWHGNLHPDNQQIIYLTLLMLPSLLFICLFGLNSSFLQCEKSYFIPSLAPAVFNIVWILSVLALRNTFIIQAMPWLSLSVVFASFCQWFMTSWLVRKRLKKISSPFSRSSYPSFLNLSRLGRPLILGIVGVAATQINSAIDSVFARYADPQGPAFLWYAIRIQQLPLALFAIAIAGSILPPLARAAKAQRWEEYHHFLFDALYRTWFFIFPFTFILFIFGTSIIKLLYGWGDFNDYSLTETTYCLWAYAAGLIPSALTLILAPASYAKSNYKRPAIISSITVVLNLFLNLFFISYLQWGAISIAYATSISAWFNVFLLGWNLHQSKVSVMNRKLLQRITPMTISTFFAWVTTCKIQAFSQQEPNFFHLPFYYELRNLMLQGSIFWVVLLFYYTILSNLVRIINYLYNKSMEIKFIYLFGSKKKIVLYKIQTWLTKKAKINNILY